MEVLSPEELIISLGKSTVFKSWRKKHADAFLSHFFCQLDTNGNFKSSWEVGYFYPKNKKISVFVQNADKNFELKMEDDVFKKETDEVEVLQMNVVKIPFEKALSLFKENLGVLFPSEKVSDGFVILQTFNKKTEWNFTYISTSIKFLNIKLSAENGSVDSYQAINLLDKGK